MASIVLALGIAVLLVGVAAALIVCAGMNDPASWRDQELPSPRPEAQSGAIEVFKV
jgi:hypothetical protein